MQKKNFFVKNFGISQRYKLVVFDQKTKIITVTTIATTTTKLQTFFSFVYLCLLNKVEVIIFIKIQKVTFCAVIFYPLQLPLINVSFFFLFFGRSGEQMSGGSGRVSFDEGKQKYSLRTNRK